MNNNEPGENPVQLGNDHYRCDVVLVNEMGMHVRPAMQIARAARDFECEFSVHAKGTTVDGRSILQLLSLAAEQGTTLTLEARGSEALAAVNAVAQIVRHGFDDPPSRETVEQPPGQQP